jgi:DNA-binding PucR family transcriptional regulator
MAASGSAGAALHGTADLIAGVGASCDAAGLVARAYREAREVARCIESFSGSAADRVLAVDDLGPARLFVAHAEVAAVERYVQDVIGPVLADDKGTTLVQTLHAFFDTGRSIRSSARRLDVHENTVRQRLARVKTLTGLDVAADPTDQLSVQMALLVARLRGHAALPSFGAPAAPDDA